jgi:hypothetical protein
MFNSFIYKERTQKFEKNKDDIHHSEHVHKRHLKGREEMAKNYQIRIGKFMMEVRDSFNKYLDERESITSK